MKTISDLLLDAFVVFLAITLFWFALKQCASFFVYSFKRIQQLKRILRKSGATPIAEKQQTLRSIQTETRLLTSFPEPRDWSQYHSPAYLRKGIIVH